MKDSQRKAMFAKKKPMTHEEFKARNRNQRDDEIARAKVITPYDKENLLKNSKKDIIDDEGVSFPNAPYYVTVVDKFLSDFRGKTEGKKNVLVIPAKNHIQAEMIQQEANKTPEFVSIKISEIKPKLNRQKNYVQVKTRKQLPKVFRLADSNEGLRDYVQ